jgi:hypothetical protein
MDQSKKTMRHFYCRDVLWETFEQMANDFDCSIDYLINEAMRFYARSKDYAVASGQSQSMAVGPSASGSGVSPVAAPPLPGPPTTARPAVGRRPPPVPTPVGVRMPSPEKTPAPQVVPRRVSPPTPEPLPPMETPTLYLLFNDQQIPIDKEQFIIGRGSKTSDLAIKDGNISRKHAAIIRRNGTYYIKDLGSTNGIDYKGMRIDNKRIDEGDVFHLCDYELRFTYRGT